MSLHTSVVSLSDPAALAELYAAGLLVHEHDRPHAPYWSEQEVLAMLREDDPEERFVPLVGRDEDGAVVATALMFVPLLDNLDKVYADLAVLPEHRGRGYGDAMLTGLLDAAGAESRALLIVAGYYPYDADETHPVRAFAARRGFSPANSEVRRTLELPIEDARLDAWAAAAAAHHEGYRLETHLDIVPEALRASLVDLINQLAVDAPTGDVDFDAGQRTVAVYEEQCVQRRATGRRVLETVAVHRGQAVAHSTLSIPPAGESLPHLSQWGTYVHREHRGHRLGMATKVRNLAVLQRDFPERTLVHTTNSPANEPMLAINIDLGFIPNEILGEFLLRLRG